MTHNFFVHLMIFLTPRCPKMTICWLARRSQFSTQNGKHLPTGERLGTLLTHNYNMAHPWILYNGYQGVFLSLVHTLRHVINFWYNNRGWSPIKWWTEQKVVWYILRIHDFSGNHTPLLQWTPLKFQLVSWLNGQRDLLMNVGEHA